jgi:hypothetical protein
MSINNNFIDLGKMIDDYINDDLLYVCLFKPSIKTPNLNEIREEFEKAHNDKILKGFAALIDGDEDFFKIYYIKKI